MISTIGAEAAYNNGEEWLDQMLAYVEGNIDFVIDFAARRIPEPQSDKAAGLLPALA